MAIAKTTASITITIIPKLRCIACVQTCIALNDVVLGIIFRTNVAIELVDLF